MARKRRSVGGSIGGIIAGFDQQVFRTQPPAEELVAKGAPLAPVAASDGGTFTIAPPDDLASPAPGGPEPDPIRLTALAVEAVIDLAHGGRLASLLIDGRELLVTEGFGPIAWGSFPMAPFAGRVRTGRFTFRGRRRQLPLTMAPDAIHGTVLDRSWHAIDDRTIASELGPDWPFRGRAIQRFELGPRRLAFRLELQADEPMPASMGWHPWFLRRPSAVPGSGEAGVQGARGMPPELELDLDAGAMYRRDADGITLRDLTAPTPGPWDDCFTDLRRPPVLRWPGFLELTIESDCRDWVIYTVPDHALCVEPQTAPPDALNAGPTIVEPGRPLVAEMTWTWRSLAD
jgi:aldose 1-epimerase